MGSSRVCLIFLTLHLFSITTAQEMIKRVPQGFVGMRGKKYFDDPPSEEIYKRKPQFFVGVKGKKNLYDALEVPDEYKRAPMGFVGMRGKKSTLFPEYETNEIYPRGSLIGQIDYTSKESKMDSDFPMLRELVAKYLAQIDSNNQGTNEESGEISNEIEKRAAAMQQFFGVRGKKSVNDKRPYDVSFRGKFIGVRGKKDLKNSEGEDIKFFLDQNDPPLKRKAQMGFFGMRGKKWTDDSSPEMETPN